MEEHSEDQQNEVQDGKKHGKRFLAFYIVGLFSIALVLILLSYLIQVRAGEQLEAMKSQINQQTSVAQGATQQMQTLQSTVEQQNALLAEQQKLLAALKDTLGTEQNGQLDANARLLSERYIALDALQQLRRLIAQEKTDEAKVLADKMISSYTLERLTVPTDEHSVLLGANSEEFSQYYALLTAEDTAETPKTATAE